MISYNFIITLFPLPHLAPPPSLLPLVTSLFSVSVSLLLLFSIH